MYYLQSRYYDSKICRFINADVYISTGYGIIGNNMFAYCNNIPTCYSDPQGTDLMYDCDLDDEYDMEDDYWRYAGGGGGGGGSTGATSGSGTATSAASAFEGGSVHGNSLQCSKTNYGYALVDRSNRTILKFGETINPNTRYSKVYLEKNNADMMFLTSGSKVDIHLWQHDMNEYFYYRYGIYPSLNRRGW